MNLPCLFIVFKGLTPSWNFLPLHFKELLTCWGLHTLPFINNKPIESVVLQIWQHLCLRSLGAQPGVLLLHPATSPVAFQFDF